MSEAIDKENLADLGARFFGMLVDTVILNLLSVLYVPLIIALVRIIPVNGLGAFLTYVVAIVVTTLLAYFAYFTLMEWKLGWTVGKLFAGTRVVDSGGNRISGKASAVRNLLRAVDLIPFALPYLLGIILIKKSKMKQRLGDRVAHTYVIRRPKSKGAKQAVEKQLSPSPNPSQKSVKPVSAELFVEAPTEGGSPFAADVD